MLCYVCNGEFNVRQLAFMRGDENINKIQVAITRRDEQGHPTLALNENSRLFINCNRSIIINEIDE